MNKVPDVRTFWESTLGRILRCQVPVPSAGHD